MIKDFKFLKLKQHQRWVTVYFSGLEYMVLTDLEEQQIGYNCSWLAQQYPQESYETNKHSILRDLRSIFDDAEFRFRSFQNIGEEING